MRFISLIVSTRVGVTPLFLKRKKSSSIYLMKKSNTGKFAQERIGLNGETEIQNGSITKLQREEEGMR